MLRILQAWVGGVSPEEVRSELGVAVGTMRGYSARILNTLGVHRQEQAAVAGVLCGLVEPGHITPAWAEFPAGAPPVGAAA